MTNVILSHRKLTVFQYTLLTNVESRGDNWYLDKNNREWQALSRLAVRGLVENTGEGEGRWRCYWRITEAGKNVIDAMRPEFFSELMADLRDSFTSQPGVGGGGEPDDAGTTESGKRQATKPDYGPVTKAIYHLEDELKALYRRGWITLGQFENADSAIDDFCEAINDKKAAQS